MCSVAKYMHRNILDYNAPTVYFAVLTHTAFGYNAIVRYFAVLNAVYLDCCSPLCEYIVQGLILSLSDNPRSPPHIRPVIELNFILFGASLFE